MRAYQVPLRNRLARPFVKFGIRSIFRALSPIHIEGKENIPYGQAYILAMNHVSMFDPPLIAAFWPETLEIIAAQSAFERRGEGEVLRAYGVIPVHRGDYDRVLLDKIFSLLQAGCPLLISPEGTRSREIAMQQAKPGVAYIFEKAQVPILPAGITGTSPEYWKNAKKGERQPLKVKIGSAINLPPVLSKGKGRREARQENADLVMTHIARLLPEAYHGFYAEKVRNAA